MRSIIVGTDFSKGSLVALEIATKIANTLKTDIIVMWVKQPRGLIIQSNDEELRNLADVSALPLQVLRFVRGLSTFALTPKKYL